MNELINHVSQKTGLTTEQATAAANAVIAFLKGKLPSPIAGQIDSLLKSGAGADGLDATRPPAIHIKNAPDSLLAKP